QTAFTKRGRSEPHPQLAVLAEHAAIGIAQQRRREHRVSGIAKLQHGIARVLFKLPALAARRQAEAENAVARRAARAGVPQQKSTVLFSHGGREDVHVIEAARLAERDDRPLGIALPILRDEPAGNFGRRLTERLTAETCNQCEATSSKQTSTSSHAAKRSTVLGC